VLKGLKETIQENAQIDVEFVNPFLFVSEEIDKIETYKDFKESIAVALYLSSRAVDIIVP
jgi:Tfp pilus assembly PilM family ATPase